MFSLINEKFKELFFELLPVRIYCHAFTVGVEAKVPKDVNTVQDFLVDERDQRKKLDNVFYICYFDLKQSVLTSSV